MREKPRVLVIGGGGYVGSFLTKYLQQKQREKKVELLDSCDIEKDIPWVTITGSYLDIKRERLSVYSHILFFAGCSSVRAAEENPKQALEQNCLQPLEFTKGLRKDQLFIYASSASVYSKTQMYVGHASQKASSEKTPLDHPQNPYDASKAAADYLFGMSITDCTCVGLRMGTVSGASPKMRSELVFNAMVSAANSSGELVLRNPNSWRTILYLDDLANLVWALMTTDSPTPSLVNAGSLTLTMGELATRISNHLGAKVRHLPDSRTYSFALDTDLQQSFAPVADISLEERIDQFLKGS